MAEPDDPVEAAARLEGALERIARLAARPPLPEGAAPEAAVDTTAIARRLDSLISQLRAALQVPPA